MPSKFRPWHSRLIAAKPFAPFRKWILRDRSLPREPHHLLRKSLARKGKSRDVRHRFYEQWCGLLWKRGGYPSCELRSGLTGGANVAGVAVTWVVAEELRIGEARMLQVMGLFSLMSQTTEGIPRLLPSTPRRAFDVGADSRRYPASHPHRHGGLFLPLSFYREQPAFLLVLAREEL